METAHDIKAATPIWSGRLRCRLAACGGARGLEFRIALNGGNATHDDCCTSLPVTTSKLTGLRRDVARQTTERDIIRIAAVYVAKELM
jgi:hypothetical protein